jgi:uncharacterized membrane protein
MAKNQRITRQTVATNKSGVGHQIEQSEVFDDNLLPDASEIEKLSKLDPTMIQWLKDRATSEQDFRHQAFNDRVSIVKRSEANAYSINIIGMSFALLIMLAGMAFSAYLIYTGNAVGGTIFGGVTIVSGAGLFLNRTVSKKQEDDPQT